MDIYITEFYGRINFMVVFNNLITSVIRIRNRSKVTAGELLKYFVGQN